MGISSSSQRLNTSGGGLSTSSTSMQNGFFGSVNLNNANGAFLSITNNDTLSSPRSLGILVDDGSRILTIAGDATISGINTGDQLINLIGDASGSGIGDINVVLADTGVSPGTYSKLTVNSKGLITYGSYIESTDISDFTTAVQTILTNQISSNLIFAADISDFNSAAEAITLDKFAAPVASLNLNSQNITNLADPINPQDAVTKAYADSVSQGLEVKGSVRVATTGNITLSGLQTIDGISLNEGDRVLVKDQTTKKYNGLYVASASSWSRTTDANTSTKVNAGLFTFVEEGTLNSGYGYVLTTSNPITLGTTALTFTQFSGTGEIITGNGLTKTASSISVITNNSSNITVGSSGIDLATTSVSANSYGSGSQVATFTVDSYGRITAANNTTIAITDSQITYNSETANKVFAAPDGSAGAPTYRNLVNNDLPTSGISVGTFTKITFNSKGIATVGANLNSGDITTALGFTPANDSTTVHISGTETITGAKTFSTPIISNVATGIAPLTVSSTTLITNLNADLLDGQQGSYYQNASNLNAGTLDATLLPIFNGDVSTTIVDGAVQFLVNKNEKYSMTFNNGTDWGTPSSGEYSITIPASAHGKGLDPMVQVLLLSGSKYVFTFPDNISVDATTGDVSIDVPSTPDKRFAGKIAIL